MTFFAVFGELNNVGINIYSIKHSLAENYGIFKDLGITVNGFAPINSLTNDSKKINFILEIENTNRDDYVTIELIPQLKPGDINHISLMQINCKSDQCEYNSSAFYSMYVTLNPNEKKSYELSLIPLNLSNGNYSICFDLKSIKSKENKVNDCLNFSILMP